MTELKTFNNPECTCGKDHDDAHHIVTGTLIAMTEGTITIREVPAFIEVSLKKVGWVNDDETTDGRGLYDISVTAITENLSTNLAELRDIIVREILASGWTNPNIPTPEGA